MYKLLIFRLTVFAKLLFIPISFSTQIIQLKKNQHRKYWVSRVSQSFFSVNSALNKFELNYLNLRSATIIFLQGIILSFNIYSQEKKLKILLPGNEKTELSGLYSSKNPVAYLPAAIIESETQRINGSLYKEEEDKRTLTSKTYHSENGKILIKHSSKNIHYRNKENKLVPVNPSLDTTPRGWAAQQQEYPAYLYKDGSVALSAGGNDIIVFNKNSKINEIPISTDDYTVGKNGMYINQAGNNTDKRIIFRENAIKTDYILHQPVKIQSDLIITEELEMPESYIVRMENLSPGLHNFPGDGFHDKIPVIYSGKKEKARFHPPLVYDADNHFTYGKYSLIKKNGKIVLQLIISGNWLNDPARKYPITIDPLVTGPVSYYPQNYLNSCEYPNFEKDSMLVIIPPGITITYFNVEDSYYADAMVGALMTEGYMMLSTSCGSVVGTCSDSVQSGTCYWIPGIDFKSNLACCFVPSCDTQSFYLTHGFSRTPAIYGTGCNQNSVYYTPFGQWPFSAYIEGRTVEIAPANWSVFPTTVCSDSCTIYLKASAQYGVPPYTMTHPWSADTIQFGNVLSGCSTLGTDTIALKIPGCPVSCDTTSMLSIPPPVIIDLCGDTITGLINKSITIKPVPEANANGASVCAGEPVNIPLSSCIPGTVFTWSGNNGSSGTGNITDISSVPGIINYSFTPDAAGCAGTTENVLVNVLPVYSKQDSATICSGTSIFLQGNYQTNAGTYVDTLPTIYGCDSIVITQLSVTTITTNADTEICTGTSVFLEGDLQHDPGTYFDTLITPSGCDSIIITDLTVHPLPPANAGSDATINAGDTVQLVASGGVAYQWNTGESTAGILVTPSSTSNYSVMVTDTNGCSASDDAMVFVNVDEPVFNISVPNIITPNGDNRNDVIFVHGKGIKEFKFYIFDRLGEKIFETDEMSKGWDGTRNGKQLNSAVFAYLLTATFIDESEFKEKGNITLVR